MCLDHFLRVCVIERGEKGHYLPFHSSPRKRLRKTGRQRAFSVSSGVPKLGSWFIGDQLHSWLDSGWSCQHSLYYLLIIISVLTSTFLDPKLKQLAARPVYHPADDSVEHALSVDCILDRVSAVPWSRCRSGRFGSGISAEVVVIDRLKKCLRAD